MPYTIAIAAIVAIAGTALHVATTFGATLPF